MGSLCGGSPTTSTLQQNQNVQYTPYAQQQFGDIYNRAAQVANTPYNPYGGELVAGLNGYQWGGINQIMDSANQAQPYINQGSNYLSGAGNMISGAQNPLNSGINTIQNATGTIGAGQNYINQADQQAGNAFNTIYGGIPYIGQGGNYLGQGVGFASQGANGVGNIGANDIQQYMNPYQQNVIQATLANMAEDNAQQQQQVQGNAAMRGALGGDRVGIAQSELARQQALANNQTLAGLNAQNYQQATQTAQTQQQNQQMNQNRLLQAGATVGGLGQGYAGLGGLMSNIGQAGLAGVNALGGLGALQGGLGSQLAGAGNALVGAAGQQGGLGNLYANLGLQYGNLGIMGQNAGITGGQSLLGAGTISQQNQQALDTANYQQYLQQLAFPYQQAQFMAGIGLPAAGAMGGYQTQIGNTNQVLTPPGMSLAQGVVGGTALLGGLFGSGGLGGTGQARGGRIEGFARGGNTDDMYRDIEESLSRSPIPKIDKIDIPTHPFTVSQLSPSMPQASNQSALSSITGLAGLANAGKTLGSLGSNLFSDGSASGAGIYSLAQEGADAGALGAAGVGAGAGILGAEAAGLGTVTGEAAAGASAIDALPLLALVKRGGAIKGYDDGGPVGQPYPAPSFIGARGYVPQGSFTAPKVFMGNMSPSHPLIDIGRFAAGRTQGQNNIYQQLGELGRITRTHIDTDKRGGAIPHYASGGWTAEDAAAHGFDVSNRFPYPAPKPQSFPVVHSDPIPEIGSKPSKNPDSAPTMGPVGTPEAGPLVGSNLPAGNGFAGGIIPPQANGVNTITDPGILAMLQAGPIPGASAAPLPEPGAGNGISAGAAWARGGHTPHMAGGGNLPAGNGFAGGIIPDAALALQGLDVPETAFALTGSGRSGSPIQVGAPTGNLPAGNGFAGGIIPQGIGGAGGIGSGPGAGISAGVGSGSVAGPAAPSGFPGFGGRDADGTVSQGSFNTGAPSVSVNPDGTPGKGVSQVGNPAAPAPAFTGPIDVFNDPTGFFGLGNVGGPLGGKGQGAFDGAAVTGVPGTTGSPTAATAAPGYGLGNFGGPTAGMMGMGETGINGQQGGVLGYGGFANGFGLQGAFNDSATQGSRTDPGYGLNGPGNPGGFNSAFGAISDISGAYNGAGLAAAQAAVNAAATNAPSGWDESGFTGDNTGGVLGGTPSGSPATSNAALDAQAEADVASAAAMADATPGYSGDITGGDISGGFGGVTGDAAAEAGASISGSDVAAGDSGDSGDSGDGGDGGDGGAGEARRGGYIHLDYGGAVNPYALLPFSSNSEMLRSEIGGQGAENANQQYFDQSLAALKARGAKGYDDGGDVDTFSDRFDAVYPSASFDERFSGAPDRLPQSRPALAGIDPSLQMDASNPYRINTTTNVPDRAPPQPSWQEISDVNSPQFDNQGPRRQTPLQQFTSPRGLFEFGARVLAADPSHGWGSAIGQGALGTLQTFDKQGNEDLSARQHAQKLAAEIKKHVDSYTETERHNKSSENLAQQRINQDNFRPLGMSQNNQPLLWDNKTGRVINGFTGQPPTAEDRMTSLGTRGGNSPQQMRYQLAQAAYPNDPKKAAEIALGIKPPTDLQLDTYLVRNFPQLIGKSPQEIAAFREQFKQSQGLATAGSTPQTAEPDPGEGKRVKGKYYINPATGQPDLWK